ncbi:MAG: hypothetical protein QOK15_498, partial [Nocardioidaceae bacterium]|nr:hypothetical protein [Nocardioidaceae bacterium]
MSWGTGERSRNAAIVVVAALVVLDCVLVAVLVTRNGDD